jgi:hypothetical protein
VAEEVIPVSDPGLGGETMTLVGSSTEVKVMQVVVEVDIVVVAVDTVVDVVEVCVRIEACWRLRQPLSSPTGMGLKEERVQIAEGGAGGRSSVSGTCRTTLGFFSAMEMRRSIPGTRPTEIYASRESELTE